MYVTKPMTGICNMQIPVLGLILKPPLCTVLRGFNESKEKEIKDNLLLFADTWVF